MIAWISGQTLAQSSQVPVRYQVLHFDGWAHAYITLWIGGEMVGVHLGERSGLPLRFARPSDARRFCARRNQAEKARVALVAAASKGCGEMPCQVRGVGQGERTEEVA